MSLDMGRVASNYYINVETMSYLMANLKPQTSEEMFLYHLAHSTDFKQLDARKEEMEELKHMHSKLTFVDVDKGEINEAHAKVQILFENYLQKKPILAFSLISDTAYII
jgi:replicative superfamily II helicase